MTPLNRRGSWIIALGALLALVVLAVGPAAACAHVDNGLAGASARAEAPLLDPAAGPDAATIRSARPASVQPDHDHQHGAGEDCLDCCAGCAAWHVALSDGTRASPPRLSAASHALTDPRSPLGRSTAQPHGPPRPLA